MLGECPNFQGGMAVKIMKNGTKAMRVLGNGKFYTRILANSPSYLFLDIQLQFYCNFRKSSLKSENELENVDQFSQFTLILRPSHQKSDNFIKTSNCFLNVSIFSVGLANFSWKKRHP